MKDYVYPSIFFAYLMFAILVVGAVFFFLRSWKDGYWGSEGEDVKYRMMEDDDEARAAGGSDNGALGAQRR